MPKTKISEFSATPANNTDIDSINIAEGCAPSGINDAIRELMAQLKDFQTGAVGDSFNGPVGTSTAAAGAFTTLSASSTVSGTGFSTYLASPPAIGGTAAAAGAFTTLSASGNVTLSGGTANGVAYLNGSKVVTSGSALTFNGTNTFTVIPSTGTAYNRTESTQYSTWLQTGAGNANVFWEFSAGTPVRWVDTSSGELMRLTSTGLGIGTSSPAAKLHVSGQTRIADSSSASNYILIGSGANAPRGGNSVMAQTGSMVMGTEAASNLLFITNATEAARLDSSGNLGLGVTPSAWGSTYRAMQVGVTSSLVGLTNDARTHLSTNAFFDGTDWKYLAVSPAARYSQIDNVHQWFNAPSGTGGNAITFTQAMTLDASGNMQIGTTTSAGRLTVSGKIRTLSGDIELDSGQITTNSSSNPLKLGVDGSEKARIDSSGNLLCGTTSVPTNGESGAGSATFNGAINVKGIRSHAGTAGAFQGNNFNFEWTGNPILWVDTTNVGQIATVSDYRLKENLVTQSELALPKVMQLNPVSFNRKQIGIFSGSNLTEEGFIAHELQAVIPSSVFGEKDALTEDGGIQPQSLNWSPIVSVLTKAIQEQQEIIESLKARLDAANL
jgi:hypothetical protein